MSANRFEREKDAAVTWCRDNPGRLNANDILALQVLGATTLSDSTLAFIQHASYAEIAPGRVYDAVYSLAEPLLGSTTQAALRVAIFFRRLPTLSLAAGHHHLVVFDFEAGVPDIVANMRVDVFDGGVSASPVGLCDLATWDAIRST